MSKDKATRDHLRAGVFRAVRLLEASLDERPSIDELAREAGQSKFHFQRAFRAVIGETVVQHLRRLRLEQAAVFLCDSTWQGSEIALACGYKTQQSFSRDFKRLYGMSPHQFREQNARVPYLRGHFRNRPERELSEAGTPIPSVRIENWLPQTGVCLRYYGSVDQVHKVWSEELLPWAKDNVDLTDARFFGLWFDGWDSIEKDRYRYEGAIVLRDIPDTVPSPFFVQALPEGEIAIAHARGRMDALDRAWQAFALGWLPMSGYQPRGNVVGFDEYESSFILGSTAKQLASLATGISIKMCLPVQSHPLAL